MEHLQRHSAWRHVSKVESTRTDRNIQPLYNEVVPSFSAARASKIRENLCKQWGSAKTDGETSCAYITVGTGVGVGLVVNGQPVHGLLHPEAGHLCLKRMVGDDFAGVDDLFGGPSIEGLASTVAIAARKVSRDEEICNLKLWRGLSICAQAGDGGGDSCLSVDP